MTLQPIAMKPTVVLRTALRLLMQRPFAHVLGPIVLMLPSMLFLAIAIGIFGWTMGMPSRGVAHFIDLFGFALFVVGVILFTFAAMLAPATSIVIGLESMRGRTIGFFDAVKRAYAPAGTLTLAYSLAGCFVVFGLAILVVPGFVALMWLGVCGPLCIDEKHGAIAALERSRALCAGHERALALIFGPICVGVLVGSVSMLSTLRMLARDDSISAHVGFLVLGVFVLFAVVTFSYVQLLATALYVWLTRPREASVSALARVFT